MSRSAVRTMTYFKDISKNAVVPAKAGNQMLD